MELGLPFAGCSPSWRPPFRRGASTLTTIATAAPAGCEEGVGARCWRKVGVGEGWAGYGERYAAAQSTSLQAVRNGAQAGRQGGAAAAECRRRRMVIDRVGCRSSAGPGSRWQCRQLEGVACWDQRKHERVDRTTSEAPAAARPLLERTPPSNSAHLGRRRFDGLPFCLCTIIY